MQPYPLGLRWKQKPQTDTHAAHCCHSHPHRPLLLQTYTDHCCTDTTATTAQTSTQTTAAQTSTDHCCHKHPQTTAATDTHTDQSYSRATGADIALGSSSGLNIIITLGRKKAAALSPLLTAFISIGHESLCLSLSFIFNQVFAHHNESSCPQCFVIPGGPVFPHPGPGQRIPDQHVGLVSHSGL